MELINTFQDSEGSVAPVGATYRSDGIDLNRAHLTRQNAVSSIIRLTRSNQYLVLGSPPAMGKTSLLQLVKKELRGQANGIKVLHRVLNVITQVADVIKRMEELGVTEGDDSSGSDGEQESKSRKYKEVWFLLDDAQNWYGQEYWGFWQLLVKALPVTCKTTFYVVIAATYDLSTHTSPVQFSVLPHFPHTPIEEDELNQLYRMHITDPAMHNWEMFVGNIKMLSKLSGAENSYHIGTVMQAIRLLQDWMKETGVDNKDEAAAVTKLRSSDYTQLLKRCYELPENLPETGRLRIVDAILTPDRNSTGRGVVDNALVPYTRAGILGRDGNFSCQAAFWFYNFRCFPLRALTVPNSLDDLITKSVQMLSASRLRNSLQDDFPKEAAFQHFFNETMSMNLTNSNYLIPELNTVATGENGEEISGELVFFVNGELQWCVELLRNGDKIGEHLARFKPGTGKYRNVQAKEYIVVDCRPPKRGRGAQIATDRCNLYFEENFTKCRVQMRTNPEIIISLQS